MALANRVARGLSLLLHPVFLPSIFGFIAYPLLSDYQLYHALVFIFLVALPGLLTFLFLRLKNEGDFFVVTRKNRLIPLIGILVGTIFLAVGSGAFLPEKLFPGYLIVIVFFLSFLAIVITIYWKISLHLLGWAAALGATLSIRFVLPANWMGEHGIADVFFQSNLFLSLLIICLIAAAWARFYLGSHGISQLLAGFIIGFSTSFGLLLAIGLP